MSALEGAYFVPCIAYYTDERTGYHDPHTWGGIESPEVSVGQMMGSVSELKPKRERNSG